MSSTLASSLSAEYASILASEGKKKASDLKTYTEAAIAKLKEHSSNADPFSNEEVASILVEPLILAVKVTKTAKVLTSSLALICRLISQIIFPAEQLTRLLDSLLEAIAGQQECLSIDNALRIIQIAMGIILNYPEAHSEGLRKSFDICIRFVSLNDLQEGKRKPNSCSSDVLNAASVTLRQIAMTSVVKLRELGCISTGDEEEVKGNAHILDVQRIFSDLSAKILREKTCFLQISSLNDNHCLEMVESMLAGGNASILTQIPALTHELERNLFPAIVRKFAEKQNYSVYLSILRIMKVALLDFSGSFPTTCQVIFELMLKDLREFSQEWQSILCLEVLKSLCAEENDTFIMSCLETTQSTKNLSEFCLILHGIFKAQEECTLTNGPENESLVLSGESSKNKLKNFDQLEKNAAFSFNALYQARLAFEIFSSLIERLFYGEFLEEVTVEEGNSFPEIQFDSIDFRVPKLKCKSLIKESLNPIVLVKLSENFKAIFPLLFEKYRFDASGFKLLNRLLYHSLAWSIFYGAEELFCACYQVTKASNSAVITRQLIVQFAIYYYANHSFDWYPILQICLAYPTETEPIFDLTDKMSLVTVENFVASLALLSFDVTFSGSDVNMNSCKFLLLKIQEIFYKLMEKFSEEEDWVSVFKAFLLHLAGLSFSKDDKIRIKAMNCFEDIVKFYSTHITVVKQRYQIELIAAIQKILESSNGFVRLVCYDTLLTILQSLGPKSNLTFAWPQILKVLNDAHSTIENASGIGVEQVKKKAFESLQLIFADLLPVIPHEHNLAVLGLIQGFIGQQSDLNMSLTAVEGLWKFSDHLIECGKHSDWMIALRAFHDAGLEARNEIRNAATQSLFRCVSTKSQLISSSLWNLIFDEVFFSLLQETLQQHHVEALVFAIQGLSGVIFSLFEHFISKFDNFFAYLKKFGRKLIELFDQDFGEKDEISLAACKGFKLVLTAANKSVHKNEHWEEWKFYFDLWASLGADKSKNKIYSQAVLTQYVTCFGYWHNSLLKSSPCYSIELLEESLAALYNALCFPLLEFDAVNDVQILSILQSSTLDQIKKNLDLASIPGSIDSLCMFWGKIVLLPLERAQQKDSRLPAGIALSSHALNSILPSSLSLWKIREETVGNVLLLLFQAFDLAAAKSQTSVYPLSQLGKQILLVLQETIAKIVGEEGCEMPISDALFEVVAKVIVGIIRSSIDYAGEECSLLPNYVEFIQFLSSTNIITFLPMIFGQAIMKSLFELSLLIRQRECLSFEAIQVFFFYASSMEWIMEMLNNRIAHSLGEFLDHLKLCGKVPMLNVKYGEITALLGGFVERGFDLQPFSMLLKGILVESSRQQGKQYSSIWKLVQRAVLLQTK
jgi:hypothetical protein